MRRVSPWHKGHPSAEGVYLVFIPNPLAGPSLKFVAVWEDGQWHQLPGEWAGGITHWMEMPADPVTPIAEMSAN